MLVTDTADTCQGGSPTLDPWRVSSTHSLWRPRGTQSVAGKAPKAHTHRRTSGTFSESANCPSSTLSGDQVDVQTAALPSHRQVLPRWNQGAQVHHVPPHCTQSIHPGTKSDVSSVCHCFVVVVVLLCVCIHMCVHVCKCVSARDQHQVSSSVAFSTIFLEDEISH